MDCEKTGFESIQESSPRWYMKVPKTCEIGTQNFIGVDWFICGWLTTVWNLFELDCKLFLVSIRTIDVKTEVIRTSVVMLLNILEKVICFGLKIKYNSFCVVENYQLWNAHCFCSSSFLMSMRTSHFEEGSSTSVFLLFLLISSFAFFELKRKRRSRKRGYEKEERV